VGKTDVTNGSSLDGYLKGIITVGAGSIAVKILSRVSQQEIQKQLLIISKTELIVLPKLELLVS
jgi:hypothetical protein